MKEEYEEITNTSVTSENVDVLLKKTARKKDICQRPAVFTDEVISRNNCTKVTRCRWLVTVPGGPHRGDTQQQRPSLFQNLPGGLLFRGGPEASF